MKTMKKALTMVLVLTLVFTMSACTDEKTASVNDTGDAKETKTDDTFDTKEDTTAAGKPTEDRSGAAITVPEQVNKIVALAPSIVETLMELDCEDHIIAIDTQTQGYGYGDLPKNLPAFDMMAPDTEKLAALEPDVIFISGMTDISGTDLYADLKELGICVINIPSSDSIQGIKDDITFIASCVGKTGEGNEIVADMTEDIEEIAEIGKTITDKKTVYFEIAAAPQAYSFGSGTFLNEMIEIIGAKNVLADQKGWLTVDMESVVAANPDVILTNVNYIDKPVDEILSRKGWESVKAVKDKQVYYIDNKESSLPNENIVEALEDMAEAVYPDVYGE